MTVSPEDIDDVPTQPLGARSLLLTMLGEFVYPAGGSVWTSTVVSGLATVGITERNARQALARLGDDGLIEPQRHGRSVRWLLTDTGRALLTTGAERIYSFGARAEAWDGHWLVVMCSIPESQRAKRHQLRSRLTFEGFGFLSPTIAVSPHPDREKAANDIIVELGLADTAITFLSGTGSMTSDATVLAAAWDLEALSDDYARFLDEFDAEPSGPDPSAPAIAFGDLLRLVDTWRRFPFVDPELPSTLLPETWIGARAQQRFDSRRAAQHPAAVTWFAEAEAAV